MRNASCSRDISMLKMPTLALRRPNAAFSAMLMAKRRLAHRGPAGDDDQVALLQSRGHFIELV